MYFQAGRTGTAPYGEIGTTEYNGAKTLAITLDNSGNTTFAGDVTLASTSPLLYLNNTTASTGKNWRFSSAANGKFYITQDGVVDAVTLDHTSGNATFAGTVAASNLSGTNTGDQDLSPYAPRQQAL